MDALTLGQVSAAPTSALPPVPRLQRSQTTAAIAPVPIGQSDGSVRHGSAGKSSDRGRLLSQPRRREPSLRPVTEQHRPAVDREEPGDASRYFAIETRLELKDRLAAVQSQLDGALVRAKLAWMRCFSSPPPKQLLPPSRASTGDAGRDAGRDAMTWATELVERVEALAADLTLALQHVASVGGSSSVDEYAALVPRVEQQLASLLALADRIAAAPPECFGRLETSSAGLEVDREEGATPSGSPSRKAVEKGVAYPSAPVTFDLPSMKRYCARVAPPYAAYLPPKPDKHRA